MELIKHIKEAESQAKEIIAQAGTDAAGLAEGARFRKAELLTEVEQQRKSTIEAAVAEAESEAAGEVQKLRAEGQKQQEDLKAKAEAKMDKCVEKVMQQLMSS